MAGGAKRGALVHGSTLRPGSLREGRRGALPPRSLLEPSAPQGTAAGFLSCSSREGGLRPRAPGGSHVVLRLPGSLNYNQFATLSNSLLSFANTRELEPSAGLAAKSLAKITSPSHAGSPGLLQDCLSSPSCEAGKAGPSACHLAGLGFNIQIS